MESLWVLLPYELIRHIADYLTPKEVTSCIKTCSWMMPLDERDYLCIKVRFYKVLSAASKFGELEVVKCLFDTLDVQEEQKNTPHSHSGRIVIGNCFDNALGQSVQYNRKEIFEFLLHRGVVPSSCTLNVALCHANYDLARTICQQFPTCVQDWVANNISSTGNLIALELLEEFGASATTLGVTNAARNGHINVVKWLKDRGILGDAWSLKYASAFGHDEIVQYLFDVQKIPLPEQ